MTTNKTKILTTAASVLFLVSVAAPACSDDTNEGPSDTSVVIGGDEDAGPDGNGGNGNGNGGQGNGGSGSNLDPDGGFTTLPDGAVVPNGGSTGNGGNGGNGGNNNVDPDGGVIILPDGGVIIIDPCPVPLGQDGCFNCPETTDDSEQFLNQCTDSDFSAFDNEDRIPHLNLYGTL